MLAPTTVTAALLLLAPAAAPETANAATPAIELDLHQVERNIITRTNAQRRRHGRQPLKTCPKLMKTARRHAAWMTHNRSLRHTWRDNVAENIAWGQRDSRQAVQDWMNSSGHRANLLSSRYTRIGVAAYVASDGSIYWCQQFQQ